MDNSIVEKIQKLLNKAESTTHEAEASAFLAKAQELMLRHAIEEGDLAAAAGAAKPTAAVKRIDFGKGGGGIKVRRSLFLAVATANRCRVWMEPGRRYLAIAGFENDISFVETLYASISLQMANAEAKAWKENPVGNRTNFRTNYFMAYAGRVGHRLMAAAREQQQAATERSTSTALVLADRSAEVERLVPQKLRSGKGTTSRPNASALAAGDRDGSRADLSGGSRNLSNSRKELGA